MKTFIHLGRTGDIINTLPLLQQAAEEDGHVQLVVSTTYADILDGVTYVEPIPVDVDFAELPYILAKYPEAINLQVYGKGYKQARMAPSFTEEQWRNSGIAKHWGTLPLEFDNRSPEREALLVDRLIHPTKPTVLVAVHGFSSPFTHGQQLLQDIRETWGAVAHIVDLSEVRAVRMYDLLAVYNRAAALVTIDTAHLHLAHGSKVPVLALATDKPSMWHGAAQRPEHVFYCRYSQFAKRRADLFSTLSKCIEGKRTRPAVAEKKRRIIHVYPMWKMDADTQRRHELAKATWERAYANGWNAMPLGEDDLLNTAIDIGHHVPLPFAKDLITTAAYGADPEDIVILSNSDVCFVDGITQDILAAIDQWGAFFTHRWDFRSLSRPLAQDEITGGKWYPGSDLFGFSVAWWHKHNDECPDMLMGVEYVDSVLRQLIKKHCGEAEIHQAVYHEAHNSAWKKDIGSNAKKWNTDKAARWFAENGTDDLDPFGPEEAERIRNRRRQRA